MKLLELRAPVGQVPPGTKVANLPTEVMAVRKILKRSCIVPDLPVASTFDSELVAGIKTFQGLFMDNPDGRVDPKGDSVNRLRDIADNKVIVVDLRSQTLHATDALQRIHKFHCASGTDEDPSPPGYYRIERKYPKYRSRTYDAQMDYAMFFHRGYAIHMSHFVTVTSFLKSSGVDALGSHGCIRLAEDNARELFAWAPLRTIVLVLRR
ncbi:L,D-transpeptidase [Lewinella sp. IMCC34183]|uniref:L,D-transpeptidase n=1 Tax=Lewinella sp. IMCC34183 TaxID=2248762 RepID=UPI00130028D1|nr:L,D-transpeptidase [Lewinella sp. IMCC34183]